MFDTVKTKQRSRRLPLLLAVGMVVVGGGAFWQLRDGGLDEDVAFEVYGEQVSVSGLTDQARALQALYGVVKPAGGEELETFWRDLSKSMATGLVIDRAADDEGVEIEPAVTADALSRYITSHYGEGDEGRAAFTQALADSGTSEAEVLDELARQLRVSRLFEVVTGEVPTPTEAELQAAYDARSCTFELPETRRLLNIVVADRADASRALGRVASGEPFATVARQLSQDQSTAGQGGALGLVARSQLEPAYGRAAFAARTGQVFGPVKTRFGWNVGQVVSVRPPRLAGLPEVSDQLAELLVAEQRSDVWQEWITDQLRAADVTYADTYRPAEPLSPPAGTDPSPAATAPDC